MVRTRDIALIVLIALGLAASGGDATVVPPADAPEALTSMSAAMANADAGLILQLRNRPFDGEIVGSEYVGYWIANEAGHGRRDVQLRRAIGHVRPRLRSRMERDPWTRHGV